MFAENVRQYCTRKCLGQGPHTKLGMFRRLFARCFILVSVTSREDGRAIVHQADDEARNACALNSCLDKPI